MLRFLIDEDFDNDILRGLLRRRPDLNIVRVQDVGLSGKRDPELLEWAAQQGRAMLSHDVSTMTNYAIARVKAASRCPACSLRVNLFPSESPLRIS